MSLKVRTSYTGRIGGRQSCLGRDGKYSLKNCNGSLWAQGVGVVTGIIPSTTYSLFVPLNSTSLITQDGLTFKVKDA